MVGLAEPDALASAAPTSALLDRAKRTSPGLAARLELLALLRSRRFDELTQRVEATQAAFEADPGREEQVGQMWDTFATSDPSVGPLLEAWGAAADSYAPRVALGIHHRRSGWGARGMRTNVSREQSDAMNAHFEQARKHLHRALEIHPRLAVAFEYLINIEKSDSANAESRRLVEEAARVCPSCVGPPFEHLFGLTPRWGGSYEEMERYLVELAPRIEKFSRLAVLRGGVAWERANSARYRQDYPAALSSYDEALRHGDYWQYRRFRGEVLFWLGRYEEALVDHEYWIDHGARTAEALLAKAYTLAKLRRYSDAADAIDLARRLEPTDDEILKLANYYGARR